MTFIRYNHLVQDIVLGLITNNSEYKDKLKWHGRFAGHQLSFEKLTELDREHVTLYIRKNPKKFKLHHVKENSQFYWPQLGLTLDEKEEISPEEEIYDSLPDELNEQFSELQNSHDGVKEILNYILSFPFIKDKDNNKAPNPLYISDPASDGFDDCL